MKRQGEGQRHQDKEREQTERRERERKIGRKRERGSVREIERNIGKSEGRKGERGGKYRDKNTHQPFSMVMKSAQRNHDIFYPKINIQICSIRTFTYN